MLTARLDELSGQLRAVRQGALAGANHALAGAKRPPIALMERQDWDKKQEKAGGGRAPSGVAARLPAMSAMRPGYWMGSLLARLQGAGAEDRD